MVKELEAYLNMKRRKTMPKKRTLNISKKKFEDIIKSYKAFIDGTEFKNHEQARLMYVEAFITAWEEAYRGKEWEQMTIKKKKK